MSDGDSDTTKSTETRWKYVGSLLAGVVVLSLPAVIVGAVFAGLPLSVVGQAWFTLYASVTLMAATWAFGKETLEVIRDVRS